MVRRIAALLLLLPLLLLLAVSPTPSHGTAVSHCGTNRLYEDVNEVSVSGCERAPCRLKKNTTIDLEFKFTPTENIRSVQNVVYAELLALPFPFAGVDGTSACDQIFDVSGKKAGCQLKAGQEYVYKNHLKVLKIYPKVSVLVHWELKDQNQKTLKCFEIPSKIVN